LFHAINGRGPAGRLGFGEFFGLSVKIYKKLIHFYPETLPADDEMIDYHLELGTEGGLVFALGIFNSEEQLKRTIERFNFVNSMLGNDELREIGKMYPCVQCSAYNEETGIPSSRPRWTPSAIA
jgi:hypothetical protein